MVVGENSLKYYAETTWTEGEPPTPPLYQSEKNLPRWKKLPQSKKIIRFLRHLSTFRCNAADADLKIILDRCWSSIRSLPRDNEKDLLLVWKAYSKVAFSAKEKLTFECADKQILELPLSYRYFLGLISRVFDAMFFGGYKEATSNTIHTELYKEDLELFINSCMGAEPKNMQQAITCLFLSDFLDYIPDKFFTHYCAIFQRHTIRDVLDTLDYLKEATTQAETAMPGATYSKINECLLEYLLSAIEAPHLKYESGLRYLCTLTLEKMGKRVILLSDSTITTPQLEKRINETPAIHLIQIVDCPKLYDPESQPYINPGDPPPRNVFQMVSSIPTLRYLNLTRADLPKNGLEDLTQLTNLKSLNLTGCKLTDDTMKVFLKFEHITQLNLSENKLISTLGIRFIKHLPLKNLRLYNCIKIDDFSLSDISEIATIYSLDISFCPAISDRGFNKLRRIKQLRQVNVSRCYLVTHKAIETFLKAGIAATQ